MPSFLDQFYATRADLLVGLGNVESILPVNYVLSGMSPEPIVTRYRSFSELPKLGVSITGKHLLEPRYLVVPSEAAITRRAVPQRRGGVLFAIEPDVIFGSMIFHPGGTYGQDVLISGELGVCHHDDISVQIHGVFRSRFFEGFQKIWDYHVGAEAGRLLDSGVRLTSSAGLPMERSLRRPAG